MVKEKLFKLCISEFFGVTLLILSPNLMHILHLLNFNILVLTPLNNCKEYQRGSVDVSLIIISRKNVQKTR